jgi:lipopolysaccharide transport system permease protein
MISSKVYTPNNKESFRLMLSGIFKGFKEGKDLAYRLFLRDFKASYEASLLGMLWVFLPPLATAGVWIFLNEQKVINVRDTPMAYPAFTLCGTMMWSLFTESLNKPMQRYKSAMGMMVKLNFPREAILLAAVYDLLVSLMLKLIVLVPILWALGYPPNLNWLLALPSILGLIFLGLSFGIFLAPFGILFNDIGRFISLGLPFLMYLTPVVYPLTRTGFLMKLQIVNPITPWLERIRSLLGGYEFHLYSGLTIWFFVSLVLFLLGLIAMRIALPIIVERSGS